MKAIVEYTNEEYAKMSEKCHKLHKAIEGIDRAELISVTKRYGYAHYEFNGTYTDKFVEALGRHPDSDEIIMLVDSGFSHFGAYCYVSTDRKSFSGKVNTD